MKSFKKFMILALALVMASVPAYAYTITKQTEEVETDANGNDFRRVIGYLALDSSHPAEGESLLPTTLGMSSFYRVTVDPATPPGNYGLPETGNVIRRFVFDYNANRIPVISVRVAGGGAAGQVSYGIDVSGPITYNLAYLTRVPFEAVGPITG